MKCLMIHDEPIDCVMSKPIINTVINISARQLENRPFASTATWSCVLFLPGAASQQSRQRSGEGTRGNAAAMLQFNDGDSGASPLPLIAAPAAATAIHSFIHSFFFFFVLRGRFLPWHPDLSPC